MEKVCLKYHDVGEKSVLTFRLGKVSALPIDKIAPPDLWYCVRIHDRKDGYEWYTTDIFSQLFN